MMNVDAVIALQKNNLEQWHLQLILKEIDAPLCYVQENNYWNFMLWHEEDVARIPEIDPLRMIKAKRNIDVFNQARNDAMEKIDGWILDQLTVNNPEAPLHSETPGMMTDRLSIMQLKYYHTKEETLRKGAPKAHIEKCMNRLIMLEAQIKDLAGCLAIVSKQLEAGLLQFKVYRQLKMYNDPSLNPQIYNNHESAG